MNPIKRYREELDTRNREFIKLATELTRLKEAHARLEELHNQTVEDSVLTANRLEEFSDRVVSFCEDCPQRGACTGCFLNPLRVYAEGR